MTTLLINLIKNLILITIIIEIKKENQITMTILSLIREMKKEKLRKKPNKLTNQKIIKNNNSQKIKTKINLCSMLIKIE